MRNLIPVFVKQGDIEDLFKLLIIIVSDICGSPLRFKKTIALLPYPYGMRFHPSEVFEIFDGKCVHEGITL
jgi:hypothetical protein